MTRKNNNWLNYLLVFALMLLPLQNGMAAMDAVVGAPSEAKQVCQQIKDHANHQADVSVEMDMQKHDGNCCDQDKTCQQQCTDCAHCPVVSAALNNFPAMDSHRLEYLYSAVRHLHDSSLFSLQFRPPRV